MEYRKLGKRLDLSVSALGLGTMRLPVIDGDESRIDEPLATEMLERAIDGGINYIDTAYIYHGGQSERWLGEALRPKLRERVRVATKLPTWMVNEPSDIERLFDEQRKRLRTEVIDIYLLHNLHGGIWPKMKDLGVLDWLNRSLEEKRIGAAGFSFHGESDAFLEILDSFDWQLCQIQYNFLNEDVQAGTRGLEAAAARGLGVVVMEPLLGGALADPPPPVREVWSSVPGAVPADVSLRWIWNRPEVSLLLSGMSTLEQIELNLASAGNSAPGSLPAEERELVEKVRDRYRSLDLIGCTRCGYCLPCPEGVDIPRNFQLFNDASLLGDRVRMLNRNLYLLMSPEARSVTCTRCGHCVELCPQGLAIPDELDRVSGEFSTDS